MTLKQTVVWSLVGFGSLFGILLPGEKFALPLGFFIAAGILQVWGLKTEVRRDFNQLSPSQKAIKMSREVWIIVYIDPNMLEGGVEMRLQCLLRPDDPEQELLVYQDHPEFSKFRELKPRYLIEFSLHLEGTADEADSRVVSSYLSVFRVYPPGTFISSVRPKGASYSSVAH